MAVVQTTGKLQRSSVTGAQTFTNAFPAVTTVGNTAIVTIVHYGSGVPNTRITGVTVGGTAGVKDIDKLDAGNINAVEIWRVTSMASASRDVVITLPGASGQFVTAGVEEWDNISTSSPLDQTGTGGPTAGSTAPSVTSAGTTTQANEVVYAVFCDYVGTNWTSSTPPAGYTEAWEEPNGATVEAGSAAYISISATGTQTATFTTGASMSWISVMATYKIGAGSPTINTQPQNATVYQGQTANFTVSATASGGSLSYQWKDDGVNVGTNSNSYTTAATVLGDNGAQITCAVTDSNGTTTTNAATLTVIPTGITGWIRA